jgi:hypothetical protein
MASKRNRLLNPIFELLKMAEGTTCEVSVSLMMIENGTFKGKIEELSEGHVQLRDATSLTTVLLNNAQAASIFTPGRAS